MYTLESGIGASLDEAVRANSTNPSVENYSSAIPSSCARFRATHFAT